MIKSIKKYGIISTFIYTFLPNIFKTILELDKNTKYLYKILITLHSFLNIYIMEGQFIVFYFKNLDLVYILIYIKMLLSTKKKKRKKKL
jgi:hypothetical protein